MTAAVAIIPARGGSKGIPGKNLQLVGGVPLVVRAVASCLASERIERVVVSTDDPTIAAAASAAGALVLPRSEALSGDQASSESTVVDVLRRLAELGPVEEHALLVQCTSPFIAPADLDGVLDRLATHDSAFTACPTHRFVWRIDPATGDAEPVNHEASHRERRQDRRPEVVETGAAYGFRTAGFLEAGSRFFGRVASVEVPEARALEIDTLDDLAAARDLEPDPVAPPALAGIEAVVFDFDGVMTDDRATVDSAGVESVTVSRRDGLGIARLRAAGYQLLILSTEENPVVARRAEKLRIPCIHGSADKAAALAAWLADAGVDPAVCAYVGNDINDLGAFAVAGVAVAPADAHPRALEAADLVLSARGGRGAVRELADLLLAGPEGPGPA